MQDEDRREEIPIRRDNCELHHRELLLKNASGLTARFALKSNIGPYAGLTGALIGLRMEGRGGRSLRFIVRTPWATMEG